MRCRTWAVVDVAGAANDRSSGATAETVSRVESLVWADLDDPSRRVMSECCAASDGREKPIL